MKRFMRLEDFQIFSMGNFVPKKSGEQAGKQDDDKSASINASRRASINITRIFFMRGIIDSFKYIVCVSFFLIIAVPSFAATNVIDVLVVYTKGAADTYGGDPSTRINQLFQLTNQIYMDSGVDLEVRVANTLMVDYTDENSAETALQDITYNRDPAFNGVATARVQSKADMVIFYRPFKAVQGNCGLAWVGGLDTEGDFSDPQLKDYMYAHIAFDGCGDFMTAHELGHNMGLRHSRKQDGKGGTFHFALGHGEDNKFTTIMAYQSAFNVDYWDGKVYKFSSPLLNCKGSPCGVDRNNTVSGADAVYALNITTPQIANFYNMESTASSSSNVSSASNSSIASNVANSSKANSSKPSLTTDATSGMPSGTASSVAPVNTSTGNSTTASGGGALDFLSLMLLGVFALFRKRNFST